MLTQPRVPERPYPKVRPLYMLERVAEHKRTSLRDVATAIGKTESQLRKLVAQEDGPTMRMAAWALGAPPWLLWFDVNEETITTTLMCCSTHPDAPDMTPAAAAKMAAQFYMPDPEDQVLAAEYDPERYSLPAAGHQALDPEPVGPRYPNTRTHQAWHWDIKKRNPKAMQKGLPPGYQFTNLGWSWNAPYPVWILQGWTLDMMLKRGYLKYNAKSSMPEGFVHHNTKKKLAGAYRKK